MQTETRVPATRMELNNTQMNAENRCWAVTEQAFQTGYTGMDPNSLNGPPHPEGLSIHRLFELQVDRSPDATALIWNERQLTYEQTNYWANRVAHALIQHGLRTDDRIGLYAERGLESVIGMLAILKSGAAYLPLDPSYPEERLRFMCSDSSPVAILTTSPLLSKLPSLGLPIVLLDGDYPDSTDNPSIPHHTSRNLAYVCYTSGSTGMPKGVMVEHRNVVQFAMDNSYAPLYPGDSVAHCATLSFDATTWEVWAPLLNGAQLVIVPSHTVLNPVALNRELVQKSVTALLLTVGLLNEYVDELEEAFSRLHYLITGGDALASSIAAHALGKKGPPKRLVNAYGPTETTAFVTTFEMRSLAPSISSVPIGKPITNAKIYILSDSWAPVPVGSMGQIFIGGQGVSRGYINQTALTAERFVADPFNNAPNARMYTSGDLGRWLPDGTIEFNGRNDFQVKIRGFRVELGELEAVLQSFPGVKQAVAVAREREGGLKRLIAYFVPESQHSSPSHPIDVAADGGLLFGNLAQQLREHLKGKLPPHMIPAAIVPLNHFPLAPNGKVDRRALPEPDIDYHLTAAYVAACTPTEKILSEIWKDALKVSRVGVEDNFFELGGDSLLGIEMNASVKASLGVEVPFMAVFEYSTVRKLAQLVDELKAEPLELR